MNKIQIDFDRDKSLLWAYGILVLFIIIAILGILQQFIAIGITAIVYMMIFIAIMYKLEMASKDMMIAVQNEAAGLYFLDSNTTVKEDIFEESEFKILKISTYEKLTESEQESLDAIGDLSELIDEKVEQVGGTTINIEDYKINVFEMLEHDSISGYANQPFERFVVLAPQQGIDSYLLQTDIGISYKGKWIQGTRIYGDHIFITWLLPDFPLLLFYNSPKLHLNLTSVRKNLEGVGKKIDSTYRNEILEHREKNRNFDVTIHELNQDAQLMLKRMRKAQGREEYAKTEGYERLDNDVNPDMIYVNKTGFYISIFANFTFLSLLLAFFLWIRGIGIW